MSDIKPMRIGLIGCGDIARKAYVPACRKFPFLELAACADLDVARAQAFAGDLGIARGCGVEELLADAGIELVINLTIPKAHTAVDLRCLAAGKHVFSEKPFALTRAAGEEVLDLANRTGLRVGCAPDTVLGCGVQTARGYIDDGMVGRILSGSAFFLGGGAEDWHPSPEFLYQVGGGPMFDMGPYYIHTLITLLGPVRRVSGSASKGWEQRTITSLPKRGTVMQIEVPTHVVAILEFRSGAVITLTTSCDVKGAHSMPHLELYGSEGSIQVPDPNFCDGPVRIARRGLHDLTEYRRTHPYREGSRGVGVADMALAIRTGREHRANADIAMHAVDIMQAVHEASASGRYVELTSTCERPAAMRPDLPDWQLDA